MRLYCLRSKFRSGYAVLEQEPVKVPPRDSSFLGRRRNVAATLPKEAQDSLTLELADEPFLPRKQAIVGGTREAAGFLQVKGEMLGLDRPITGENNRSLDDVLELAKVPWPGISLEEVQGVSRDPLHLLERYRSEEHTSESSHVAISYA